MLLLSSTCLSFDYFVLFFSHERDMKRTKEALAMALHYLDDKLTVGRLGEIGELFAAGLMRLHQKQSRALSAHSGESLLPILGHQSSHATPATSREDA